MWKVNNLLDKLTDRRHVQKKCSHKYDRGRKGGRVHRPVSMWEWAAEKNQEYTHAYFLAVQNTEKGVRAERKTKSIKKKGRKAYIHTHVTSFQVQFPQDGQQ